MVVPKSEDKMYYPPPDLQRDAHVPNLNWYLELYRKSLENPEGRTNTCEVIVLVCVLILCIPLSSCTCSISLSVCPPYPSALT